MIISKKGIDIFCIEVYNVLIINAHSVKNETEEHMKFEQLIATYRQSGFDGVPGWGVLSKSRGFSSDDAKKYAQKPYFLTGTAFSYEYKDGKRIFSRATASGEAVLSDGSRVRNIVTHTLTGKDIESLPCEYISSGSFVHGVSDADASCADGTDYLPKCELTPSNTVNVNRIMNFLGINDRQLVFRRLLFAVTCPENAGKPIFICDDEENIPLWIGAVSFALPKAIIDNLSFTTCCIPSDDMKMYRICGIRSEDMNDTVKGNAESLGSCLFDLKNGDIPEYPVIHPVYEFLSDGMLHAYKYVEDFKSFAESCFNKVTSDRIQEIYTLYTVVRGGISSATYRDFAVSAVAVNNFGNDEAYIRLTEAALADRNAVCAFDPAYVSAIFIFICGKAETLSYKLQNAIKEYITHVSLAVICSAECNEEKLFAFYEKAAICAESSGVSLPCRLMSQKYRRFIVNLLASEAPDHKIKLVCKIFKEYLIAKNMTPEDLTPESEGGSFVTEYIKACAPYSDDCVKHIMYAVSYDPVILCSAYLTAEAALEGRFEKLIPVSQEEFICYASAKDPSGVYRHLMDADRTELLFAVFTARMNVAESADELTDAFEEHDKNYFSVSDQYFNEYYVPALEFYCQTFRSNFSKKIEDGDFYALHSAAKHRVCIKYSDELCENVARCDICPSPNKKQTELLWLIANYVRNVCHKPVSGRLLCLCFASLLEDIDNQKSYEKIYPTLVEYTKNGKVDLSSLSEKELDDYISWLVPNMSEYLPDYDTVCGMYGFFSFTQQTEADFIAQFTKPYVKQGKSKGDYTALCEFAKFVINFCSDSGKRACARQITKLNSKNIEALRVCAEFHFDTDLTMIGKFNDLLNTEPEKTSIFQKLFGKKNS